MKNSLTLVLMLGMVVVLTLGACALKAPSFSPEVEQKIEQVLVVAMEKFNIPGAVLGVWVPDRGTWVQAEGTADLERGRDIKSTDTFRIGSVTKTFTSVKLFCQLHRTPVCSNGA